MTNNIKNWPKNYFMITDIRYVAPSGKEPGSLVTFN